MIWWKEGVMCVQGVRFDARLTLIDSAQVFHWREQDGKFFAVVGGASVCLLPTGDGFELRGTNPEQEAFFAHYFDLTRDYSCLSSACAKYPLARQAVDALPGLRVLNQPPWEALVSFITSANNNVGRIRKLVNGLMDRVGQGMFPSPQCLAETPETILREIGVGYRAPYLIATARRVAEGFPLNELSTRSYEEAHALLLELPGVGDKVADCVQLFSTGHANAFPVDVWVDRLMREWFHVQARTKRQVRQAALEMFGANAGLIQQYLFHCARMGLVSPGEEKPA